MEILQYPVKTFTRGLINSLEPQSIPDGSASVSDNWVHKGDKVELRRGSKILGTKQTGTGRVRGLGIGIKHDGTEILFVARSQKVEYYDSATEDFVEVGTNELGNDIDAEDIVLERYSNLAGTFVYVGNPNMPFKKIHVANPGDISDQETTDFRGLFRIKSMAMFLYQRKGSNGIQDTTGLYRSVLDKDEVSDYTEITTESVGTGDGSETNFTGTLAFKAAGSKRTCHGVRITDGTEIFVDDYNGNLVGDQGGEGTINYSTGAFDITFNSAPANAQAITADYYWEDATSDGILDFTKSTPRTGGEGFVIRQDDGGGKLQDVLEYDQNYYCPHESKTWVLSLPVDDGNDVTNLPFRERMGIPNRKAAVETGDGIYYIDNKDEKDPKIRLAGLNPTSEKIEPVSISDMLDLASYRFDQAEGIEWGTFILFAFRHKDTAKNNTVLVYDREIKSFFFVDYWVSHFAILDGVLIGGDSVSDNVYELFSGWDDDDANITNLLSFNMTTLGIEGLKKVKVLEIEGEIQADQKLKISLAFDQGDPIEVGGSVDGNGDPIYAIEGGGDYVDSGQGVDIGSLVIGSSEIGGGSDGEVAFPFKKEIIVNTDRFHFVELVVQAMGLGYASITKYNFRDVRHKGRKVPLKYR